jgi:hypothetical protein
MFYVTIHKIRSIQKGTLKMKIITKLALIATSLLITAACTSTTVIPHASGMFTITATASSEEKADRVTTTKAQAICEQQGGKPKVIDLETTYQGIDAAQQKLAKLANQILPPSEASGPYMPSDHKYKSTLVFKCEEANHSQ